MSKPPLISSNLGARDHPGQSIIAINEAKDSPKKIENKKWKT
jgi:hypothetical protein